MILLNLVGITVKMVKYKHYFLNFAWNSLKRLNKFLINFFSYLMVYGQKFEIRQFVFTFYKIAPLIEFFFKCFEIEIALLQPIYQNYITYFLTVIFCGYLILPFLKYLIWES